MSKRTQEEINAQIEGLQTMKKWLPEKSMLGNENWKEIDVQISILKLEKTIDDFEEDFEMVEENGSDDVYDRAKSAQEWLDGQSDDDLFEVQ